MYRWRKGGRFGLAHPSQVNLVNAFRSIFLFTLAFLWHLSPVEAGHKEFIPASPLPQYTQECAACHIAYPPAFLSVDSWLRIMAGLSQHFGVDASLEPDQIKLIGRWLASEGGTYKKVQASPPHDRISRSNWFLREHRRVDSDVWILPSVKSPAQCNACHTHAERGRFNERELRPPPGMTGGFR